MIETTAEWRVKLKPWLSILSKFGLDVELPLLHTVTDINEHRLRIAAPNDADNTIESWIWLTEAMELLELLARVDHRAARQLLFDAAGKEWVVDRYGDVLFASPDVLPRFVLDVQDESILQTEKTVLDLYRFSTKHSEMSADYDEVKQAMLTRYAASHDGQAFDRETHGRVKVALAFDVGIELADEDDAFVVFFSILDALVGGLDGWKASQGERPDNGDEGDSQETDNEGNEDDTDIGRQQDKLNRVGSQPERGAFIIDTFRLSVSSADNVSDVVIDMLIDMCKTNSQLSYFSVANLMYSQLNYVPTGFFLFSQVAAYGKWCRGRGIKNLTLSMGAFDAAAVRAFCSAIVCSRSLRTFTFDQWFGVSPHLQQDVVSTHVWWRWLAYALFSQVATHEIDSANLSVKGLADMAVIDAVRGVLESNNPAIQMYQAEGESSDEEDDDRQEPSAAVLNATATLGLGFFSDFDPDAESDATRALEVGVEGMAYQILRNRPEEDFIEIVVPGSGVAWAERFDIVALQPLPRRTTHSIRYLSLSDLSGREIRPTIALLELIGQPIEYLLLAVAPEHITTVDDPELWTDTLLEAALTCCPNLKHLDLGFVSFESFGWLCEPTKRVCKLEKLAIRCRRGRTPSDWSPLFDTLSNPVHPLTQSLRELSVAADDVTDSAALAVHDEMMRQYIAMLDKNTRLERCELTAHVQALIDQHAAKFHAHRLKFVSAVEAPLNVAQKLAFLSVMTPSTPDQGRHLHATASNGIAVGEGVGLSRHLLSPETIEWIFEFGATPKRRRCMMPMGPDSTHHTGEDGED